MDRRDFLKAAGAAGAMLSAAPARSATDAAGDDGWAVLVDTTQCGGCRSCEEACAKANGNPVPDISDDAIQGPPRETTPGQWTVTNRYEAGTSGEVFRKHQCMHCVEPACAAACLTKALVKTAEGPVIWREDKCMGCRYCMISCPFDVPKFQYDEPVPKIQKCQLCFARLQEGQRPACVEDCPPEALTFGKRRDLLLQAHARIAANPGKYVPHVYGEREAGGTSFLYLSAVPFEELGLRTDLGTRSYPEMTKEFLYAVPVVLALWPPFLLALARSRGASAEDAPEEDGHER